MILTREQEQVAHAIADVYGCVSIKRLAPVSVGAVLMQGIDREHDTRGEQVRVNANGDRSDPAPWLPSLPPPPPRRSRAAALLLAQRPDARQTPEQRIWIDAMRPHPKDEDAIRAGVHDVTPPDDIGGIR